MAVGIFVIVGFILVGVLIMQFANLATFAQPSYDVKVLMNHSSGITKDKAVHYLGLDVGTVRDVKLAEDLKTVVVTLTINSKSDIPGNAVLSSSMGTFGDAYLDITLPKDQPLLAALPHDGTGTIQAQATASLSDRLEQVASKFDKLDFDKLAKALSNLEQMLEERSPEQVAAGAKPNLSTAITQFNLTLATLNDEKNPANLKLTMGKMSADLDQAKETLKGVQETFSKASFALDKTTADVDEVKASATKLMGKLYDDSVRLSNLLDTMNSLAKGVQEGEGTVGKLLKSDQLHKELSLLILQMNSTFQDISRLVTKLEEEGLMRKGG
jgi:phospholipid/cholesterol/gamma-HCH transport system substrate-binding protein